jgi:hypothetical protein
VSTFLLLLGFAVLKMTIGAAIVWLGARSRERPEDDGGFGPFDTFDPPDGPSSWDERRRRPERHRTQMAAPARGGPHRESVLRRRPQRV